MSSRLFITTTLPYVNAAPHVGFALEIVQADAYARFRRSLGDEVFFSTGTDEHGQKIAEAAKKAGEGVQAYVDRYADEVKKLRDALDLSTDNFIRTTDPHHIEAAQEMWRLCDAAGDIYKKAYTGLYCVGCESFKTEKEIVDGTCELHPSLMLEEVTEENYFFRFSKYADYLLEYLSRPDVIIPEWRRAEAVTFVKGGLEDFSISRESARLSWGVPVPGDDGQTMYVWFDALTDYISTLGWPDDAAGNFKKFWLEGETLQMAGKDQVRFQSLMWQAMLKSAGIKATDRVFYHGFINSGGQRMSKSSGNVISPYDLVQKYGTDATRYMLLRHVHPTEDSDVTWEKLDEWYEAGLANGIGNLAARIMKLSEAHLLDGGTERSFLPSGQLADAMSRYDFSGAMNVIWDDIQVLDQRITIEEPFKLVKNNPEAGKGSIEQLRIGLSKIASSLQPFMPDTSKKILDAIVANKKPENLFPRLG
ncbi:MAG: methionine--tRNA ligase [Patescibacteria group bacterium]|nr:methionine--tRNA ligase [Patescibacteria group bacterium]